MDYNAIIEKVKKQEELLRFQHFTNDDAWELGKLFAEKIKADGIQMAVMIKKVNGNTIFSHFSEGTYIANENWMRRKFNMVLFHEQSSFLQWAFAERSGNSYENMGLNEKDYALCGGGFPIKLANGEMVAVVLASNLPHDKDHKFIVEGLASYLGVTDVPEVIL